MCQQAEKVIILAESSKFDNIGATPVVSLSQVYMVITNKDINKEKLTLLENSSIKTIVV